MAIVTQTYDLNIEPGLSAPVTIHCSQYDTGREIVFNLLNGGSSYTIPSGAAISVHGIRRDGANFGPFSCTYSGSNVRFTLQDSMTAAKGSAIAEVVISKSGQTVATANFAIMVEAATFPNGVTYDTDPSVYADILRYVMEGNSEDISSAFNAAKQYTDNLVGNIIAHNTDTSSNTELIDIRTGADGTVHQTAGGAVRSQIGGLKSDIDYANDKISDLNGVIYVNINSFEIGNVYVTDTELNYANSTTKIRTKQGTFYKLKQGDVISMTSSGIYKYYWIYSANGTSWMAQPTILDSHAPVTVETTGYYTFAIMGQSSITFDDATMKTAAGKLKIERDSPITIKAITDRITDDENDYAVKFAALDGEISFANDKLSDINGIVYVELFEIGTASVSNSALTYSTSTTKIRTKQGVYNCFKQGDVVSMTTSNLYKYLVHYSADGETWVSGTFVRDAVSTTIPVTGYCVILIGKMDDSAINASEVAEIASKINCTRTGVITTLTNRIAEDETDIENNENRLNECTKRLFDLDGIIEISHMEIGSVECTAENGFVYSSNTKRIRTPQGVTIPLQKGDIITSSDWTTTRFYGGYKKQDNTYVQITTKASNYEMPEDGELVLSLRYEPSADISDIHALQSMFTIHRPKEEEEFVEAKETLKHNDIYYTGREIRRIYNPYHNGGNLLLSGQLHCHTRYKQDGVIKYYNDGSDSIAFGNYREAGYDWMTVTNYGNIGEVHHPDAGSVPEGLIWLFDSQEAGINGTLGTSLPTKHSCVYNGVNPYDWQAPMTWQDWADITKLKGEMITIAHPFWDQTYQPPEVLETIKGHIRFCEVYNGEIINNGYTVETPDGKDTDYAWETMLDNGLVTWGTAVSDAHTCTNMTRIKDGCVKVFSASKDRMSIIQNLCCGNFIACSNIDAGIEGISFANGMLTIETGDSGATTQFLKEGGEVLSTQIGATASYMMAGTEKYVRAVITLTGGSKVWTQPIINLFSMDYDDYLELSM